MICKFQAVTGHICFLKWNLLHTKTLLQTKAAPIPCSIFWFLGVWVNIWHRNKAACSELNPVQSSRSKLTTCPRKGRMLRFELDSTATSDGGAQKLRNDVSYDPESIATKNCSQIGRKWNAMSERHELRFSIWRCFKQSAFVNNRLLYYWPTIHNSISKICPKFQVISSHFFEVDELLDEHWAKIVQSENISTPIYVECDKTYWVLLTKSLCAIIVVLSVWVSLALIFNLNNLRMITLQAKKRFQVARYNKWCIVFFWDIDWNSWLSGSGSFQWVGLLGFNSRRMLKLLAAPWPFCVALSQSVHWH